MREVHGSLRRAERRGGRRAGERGGEVDPSGPGGTPGPTRETAQVGFAQPEDDGRGAVPAHRLFEDPVRRIPVRRQAHVAESRHAGARKRLPERRRGGVPGFVVPVHLDDRPPADVVRRSGEVPRQDVGLERHPPRKVDRVVPGAGNHGGVHDGEEARDPVPLAEPLDGSPPFGGDPADHGEDGPAAVILLELRIPCFLGARKLPDVKFPCPAGGQPARVGPGSGRAPAPPPSASRRSCPGYRRAGRRAPRSGGPGRPSCRRRLRTG